jgi:hypothetical protein
VADASVTAQDVDQIPIEVTDCSGDEAPAISFSRHPNVTDIVRQLSRGLCDVVYLEHQELVAYREHVTRRVGEERIESDLGLLEPRRMRELQLRARPFRRTSSPSAISARAARRKPSTRSYHSIAASISDITVARL